MSAQLDALHLPAQLDALPLPAQLDALPLAFSIKERLVDFALDSNFVHDPQLTEICRNIWHGPSHTGGLLADLWVEGAFPPEAAPNNPRTLEELVAEGSFSPALRDHLHERGVMPGDRPLYTHQRDAVLAARQSRNDGKRPALVVTAGTGAGKTESFLLPMLNDLFESSVPTTPPPSEFPGVKCLILYPMNALVNDQVDRLYNWLQKQTGSPVTLFHFTGETPENATAADREDVPKWDPCRFRTRQQARGLEDRNGKAITEPPFGPVPDILVTNYSMLEYMLCRPQDTVFFGPALRTIVLDEAHLYTGTLAAEITLLLRRLLQRCGLSPNSVLQIATSATLGTGDLNELKKFAATLFSKSDDLVQVLRGERQRISFPEAIAPMTPVTAQQWANLVPLPGATLTHNVDNVVL